MPHFYERYVLRNLQIYLVEKQLLDLIYIMSKELLISISFGGAILVALVCGMVQPSVLSSPFFLLVGLVCVIGQIVMAHLAFNQYKHLSTQTPNEGNENDREERSDDGFDD